MKNKAILMIMLCIPVFLNSCQDVIDVELDTEEPRLVIDASITWLKGTTGANQAIRLTTTTDFYTAVIPPVSGATVFIQNSSGVVFNFSETPTTGIYLCADFAPVIGETYTLTVISDGQTYTSTETLEAVAAITSVSQEIQNSTGNDFLKLKTFFNDPADADNFYLYKYKFSNSLKPDYSIDDDSFFQGNTFYSLVLKEDITVGEQVEITHYGISPDCFNYISVLISVAGNSGGPFQSPPATVRGNIENETNHGNYALGYFRLSEADTIHYTIQ